MGEDRPIGLAKGTLQFPSSLWDEPPVRFSVLDQLDLELGCIIGIQGESGSGKSVLLRCVVDSLARLGMTREDLVYIPQELALLPDYSIASNARVLSAGRSLVAVTQELSERDAAVLLHCGRLSPACLSGGERRRLAIACGLAREPRVMFLDESLAALDPASVYDLLHRLRAAIDESRVGTIVVIAHSDVVLSMCDSVFNVHICQGERKIARNMEHVANVKATFPSRKAHAGSGESERLRYSRSRAIAHVVFGIGFAFVLLGAVLWILRHSAEDEVRAFMPSLSDLSAAFVAKSDVLWRETLWTLGNATMAVVSTICVALVYWFGVVMASSVRHVAFTTGSTMC